MSRPSAPGGTWVVWDLGNVLVPAWDLAELAGQINADPDRFAAAYWAYRQAYDLGGTAQEYWSRVVRDGVPVPGDVPGDLDGDVDGALVDRLARADAQRWTRPDPAAQRLLDGLAAQGVPLALLSNAPLALAEEGRRLPWLQRFAHLMFSAEEGLAKPDPAIYQRLTGRLGCAPGQVLFFDDRSDNVLAAIAHGWRAHLWEGTEHARSLLTGLGLLA